jgi:hypothetical protein
MRRQRCEDGVSAFRQHSALTTMKWVSGSSITLPPRSAPTNSSNVPVLEPDTTITLPIDASRNATSSGALSGGEVEVPLLRRSWAWVVGLPVWKLNS